MCGSLRVWKRRVRSQMGSAAMLTACSYPKVRAGHGAAGVVSTVVTAQWPLVILSRRVGARRITELSRLSGWPMKMKPASPPLLKLSGALRQANPRRRGAEGRPGILLQASHARDLHPACPLQAWAKCNRAPGIGTLESERSPGGGALFLEKP